MNPAEEQFATGVRYSEAGDHASAESAFTAAISAGADDADVYFFRALSRDKLRDWPGVESDLTSALDRGLRSPAVFVLRARARWRQGRQMPAMDDAFATLRETLRRALLRG